MAVDYLLSTDDLRKKGLIHVNTDTKLLSRAIQLVQDMEIQPILGSPLFRALLTRVRNNDWNADYRELMDDYVVPALVASVDAQIVVIGTNKITNKGTGRTTDDNFNPNNTADNSLYKDRLESFADFYKRRLVGFLCDDNGEKYTEYDQAITRTSHDLRPDKKSYRIPWVSTTQEHRYYDCDIDEIERYKNKY